MSHLSNFQKKYEVEKHRIFTNEHWIVSVRPEQITIGSLLLSLRRECTSMGYLHADEGESFSTACSFIEKTLKAKLSPEKVNYMALMMVDPQVHFHVVPRYSKPVFLGGTLYNDAFWPRPVEMSHSLPVNPADVLFVLKS